MKRGEDDMTLPVLSSLGSSRALFPVTAHVRFVFALIPFSLSLSTIARRNNGNVDGADSPVDWDLKADHTHPQ